MGDVKLPKDALYGASTQRAVENFPISGIRFGRDFLSTLAALKSSAAQVNSSLGQLEARLAKSIQKAAEEVEVGKWDHQFPIDIFQTGSGTSTNMNFNEVVSNLANVALGKKIGSHSPIHPNDHVNLGQSSNDVIPTVIHVTACRLIQEQLLPALTTLNQTLEKKSKDFQKIIKVGRTHLQDATPITLGQEFSGYARQVFLAKQRVENALGSLLELPLGGTAVGTGINTDKKFAGLVIKELSKKYRMKFKEADNHFEAQGAKDACVEMSGALKTCAVGLTKIANDIRWLSSGPRCGLGELTLPPVQPGSSIMPGKINPVICEALLQVCVNVMASDLAITLAAQSGNFELNMMMPLIAHHLLQAITTLSASVRLFDEKCVRGLTANEEHLAEILEKSLMLATPLAPVIGYEKAAEIAKLAFKEGKTIRETAQKHTKLSSKELDKILDPKNMI